jgi:hypothetical protein
VCARGDELQPLVEIHCLGRERQAAFLHLGQGQQVIGEPVALAVAGTTAGPAEGRARSSRRQAIYLMMMAPSMSTCAHFVPVLHALGLTVLFLPSTVTVTVCVPAAIASRAQTTRRGWTVGE